jgi:lysophospholipase L1-like esterase
MSTPGRRSRAGTSFDPKAIVKRAIAAGRAAAEEGLTARKVQRRARSAAKPVRAARPRRGLRAAPAAPVIPKRARALLGPGPASGVLLAEGDSWFDYPGKDILQLLEDRYLFDVVSVANKGDRVEDMAHSPNQYEELARQLEKLLRAGKVPRAILLSGGGNDIAGDEFAILLNHAASGLAPLNEDVVRGVIDVRLRAAYASIIGGVTRIVTEYLGKTLPIVTHGYDYAVPDGRGFMGGFWFLPGPWLEPGFRLKGHANLNANKAVVVSLIDSFNRMLNDVSSDPAFKHVHYVNLRDTLRRDAGYKHDWANELHPTPSGFALVTKKIADVIAKL